MQRHRSASANTECLDVSTSRRMQSKGASGMTHIRPMQDGGAGGFAPPPPRIIDTSQLSLKTQKRLVEARKVSSRPHIPPAPRLCYHPPLHALFPFQAGTCSESLHMSRHALLQSRRGQCACSRQENTDAAE